MLTTLPHFKKKNHLSLRLYIFFLVLFELLILSTVASGQELYTSLPAETVVCAGIAGITLVASADHPNKELEVQWQILTNGSWTNVSGGTITNSFSHNSTKVVTTSRLYLTDYAHALAYRVAFGVNNVNPQTATAITSTTIIIPAANFTIPVNNVYLTESVAFNFSDTASANATYQWSFSPAATFTSGYTAQSKNTAVNWSTPGEKKITLTITDGLCTVTKEKFINIYGNYTWIGGKNSDWFFPANWSYNAVPGALDDVTIATAPFLPRLNNNTSIRNLTVQSGSITLGTATLTVSGDAIFNDGTVSGGEVIFNGDIEVNSPDAISNSHAVIAGSTQQKIKNTGLGGVIFTNLSIDKTHNHVTLETAITVNRLLDLKNGHALRLANADLQMGAAARIVSGIKGYVVTNGTGTLQMTVGNNQTDVFFPVGNHSYNPVKIRQTLAGTPDVFKVRVQGGLFDLYGTDNNGVEPAVEDGISRTWVIEEGLPGGSVAQVTLQFSPNNTGNDWAPSFDLDKAVFAQYTNSWAAAKMGKPMLNGKNNMLEVSQPNITSFRLFGLFNNDHQGLFTLPVELISFTAKRTNSQVELQWTTATEKNNDFFTLEQSFDGKIFNEVAPVKGAGNSTRQIKYDYLHKNAPARLTYYRLKQTDFDGTVSYSKIVVVNALSGGIAVSAYPNPSTGLFKLTGVAYGVEANIIGANGRPVKKLPAFENDFTFDLTDQPAGIYILHLNSGNEIKTIRLVKK